MPFEVTKFENHADKIAQMEKLAIQKTLTEIGMQAERHAKQNCRDMDAVDTGLLRNSITFALDGREANIGQYKADKGSGSGSYSGTAPKEHGDNAAVYIGSNVEYAPYVELGTSRMSPRPYLKNAVENYKDEYKAIIEKNMKNA